MAGDETKPSEARTEADAAASEGSAPAIEPSIAQPRAPESASPSEPAAADENASAEDVVPDEPRASSAAEAEPASAPIEEAADAVQPAASSSRPEPPARAPLLARLVPFLVVFALGALIAIGSGFLMSLLGGSPETRGEIDQRLAALDERATSLERKQERDGSALGALANRLGAVETDARQAVFSAREVEKALAARPESKAWAAGGTATEPADPGPLSARMDAIERILREDKAALGSTEPEPSGAAADTGRAQAIAIVAGRLVQEVEHGEKFLHEVNALLVLGVDEAKLAPLRTFADEGVATPRRLSEDFARLAPVILAAERKASDGSLAERLKGYASSLVQIERMDESQSKEVRGLVAQIKLALAHDRVADAYALWSELPDAPKASSASFGTSAKNRLDTLDAARSIEAGAVAALGKPKS